MDRSSLNPLFQSLQTDYLYHLGLDSSMNLEETFKDTEYVIFTRSFNNSDLIASEFIKSFYQIKNTELSCKTIGKNERYHLHKIHNTLIVSHGVGAPSLLICLNEIVKLLWHSKAQKPKFFRTSLADGIGVEPGTIIIGSEAVNNSLRPQFKNIEFGEEVFYPSLFDSDFSNKVLLASSSYHPVMGKIMTGSDFYNGQARLNGASPLDYTVDRQQQFLNKAYQQGVRSIDMESLCFAGFCYSLKIPSCGINGILVDRLNQDEIDLNGYQQQQLLKQTASLIINYIINH